jgi:capsule biosynthesis phosphatase
MIDWNEIDWKKTIVCDVDDTISTHKERAYASAVPHLDIINKLNRLFDMGYVIIYFTARGTLSCNGDIDKIEQARRPILEEWMKRHGVKYHHLLFGKPLGIMYIDDKAMTPERFMELEFDEFTELIGGSGAEILREGDRVRKTAKNCIDQHAWYEMMKDHVRVPKMHSIIYDTIDMEFVEGVLMSKLHGLGIMMSINEAYKIVIEKFSHMSGTGHSFDSYVERVKDHLMLSDCSFTEEVLEILKNETQYFNRHSSFCHGDLTLENMIVEDGGTICFIDPNYDRDCWSSYLLDIAKMYQSVRFNYEFEFTGNRTCEYPLEAMKFFKIQSHSHLHVTILEMTHWIRMLKYKKTETERKKIKDNVQNLISEIKTMSLRDVRS